MLIGSGPVEHWSQDNADHAGQACHHRQASDASLFAGDVLFHHLNIAR